MGFGVAPVKGDFFLALFPQFAVPVLSGQDVPWALYSRKASSRAQVPCDGHCEQCYTLWSQNFPWMSWESLVTRHSDDKAFAELVREVREIRVGSKPAPAVRESVVTEGRVKLQRSFLTLLEREMKRDTGLNRIPKTAIKNLPSVTMKNEQGNEETMFVFRDPQEPHRRLLVTCDVATTQQRHDLPSFTHTGQGGSVAHHVMQQWLDCLDTSGGSKVLEAVTMYDWTEFADKRLLKKGDDEKEE